ncbi:VWA domain-containing protein [Clostridium sardiniense]|uniref:VWA domain-containing protein n=1 Tax=Clostridium sardiniense TaxID=29369 RepID=A0ABS7KSY6_CLOSR|nr:vWA domain-containing protein [Clostridium sardiniense]MBY0753923.1 VWA domain-containing protein [Clostridium sardiniense]MDQ0459562.1 Mg-chelatase subunit ChlD [Clostridium sardiniense]
MRKQKRKFKFKKMAIALAFILCNCFLINAMAEPYSQANNSKQDKINREQETNGIKNSKTATPTGVEGEYEIELKVSGTPRTKTVPVDIVMIMDRSGSMENDMRDLKNAMRRFTSSILDEEKGVKDSRISVIGFSGSASVLHDFSNNAENINRKISDAELLWSGTNAQAAWLKAYDQLAKARQGANKYVLFFTDGLPNKTSSGRDAVESAVSAYNSVVEKYNGINAYSIGLIRNVSSYEKEEARSFLRRVQNQEAGPHFIEGKEINLDGIYAKIADNIKTETAMANGAIITDEVTKEFEIVNNGADAKVYKALEDGKEVLLDINPTVIGNKLSWDLGNIGTEGRIIRFKIRLKDEYYGIGDKEIPTNVEATMNYTNPEGNENTITFEKPTVNVPYKKGKITVIKEVKNNTGLTAPKDDNFNISLTGKENIGEYSVKLKDGETKILNFTLKHSDAKVSSETLKSKDFLNIGEYDIREIVPMNYELEGIYVGSTKLNKDMIKDNKFTINNTNNNITIKVVNKYVNDKYFYDKAEKENVLELKK